MGYGHTDWDTVIRGIQSRAEVSVSARKRRKRRRRRKRMRWISKVGGS